MCGVPYHSAAVYLQRLLRKGYKIALCEQMEDPKSAKGIVRREVTRVLTPGTALDHDAGRGRKPMAGECGGRRDGSERLCGRGFDRSCRRGTFGRRSLRGRRRGRWRSMSWRGLRRRS